MNRLRRMQVLNDNYRSTLAFGAGIFMSRPFFELPQEVKAEALARVASYRKFAENGHHDAGLIIVSGRAIAWRIEYRALDMKSPSRDPADPEQTVRILVIELA